MRQMRASDLKAPDDRKHLLMLSSVQARQHLTKEQGASVLIPEGREPRVLIPFCCSRDLVAVKCLEWCFIFCLPHNYIGGMC